MKSGYYFVLLLLLLASCKENKNTTATIPPAPAEQKNADTAVVQTPSTAPAAEEPKTKPDHDQKISAGDSVMTLIVSFYSIGSGIDRGQTDKLKSFIEEYGKKINKNIEFTQTHWGREGEVDYCFPLKDLSEEHVTGFISGAKASLQSAEHVHFFQNQACRKGR